MEKDSGVSDNRTVTLAGEPRPRARRDRREDIFVYGQKASVYIAFSIAQLQSETSPCTVFFQSPAAYRDLPPEQFRYEIVT